MLIDDVSMKILLLLHLLRRVAIQQRITILGKSIYNQTANKHRICIRTRYALILYFYLHLLSHLPSNFLVSYFSTEIEFVMYFVTREIY